MNREINIEDYTYNLPSGRIARYPLTQRDHSKLLVYDRGTISHRPFHELTSLISPGLVMVFNDTRVVQARLKFEKPSGSKIEIFCLEPHEPSEYNLAFQSRGTCVWKCLVGNAKKWKEGFLTRTIQTSQGPINLEVVKEGRDKDAFLIRFRWQPEKPDFASIMDAAGTTPIPPYLDRDAVEADKDNYQTVYSKVDGSVAAPTAGLHFTDGVLDEISRMGIPRINLTLHVGAGTFQPVSGELQSHPMHAERFFVSADAIEKLLIGGAEILAVGTTTTRILESLFWLGCKIHADPSAKKKSGKSQVLYLDQWEPYSIQPLSRKESLSCLLEFVNGSESDHLEAVTRLMIIPGYLFRMTDRMITNFHQPRSTLLLLVGAFIGEDWKKVYRYASENEFRFLSYGDSSILVPKKA